MTKKRYLAVAGLLAILVVAGFGVGMMLPAPGVTKANFNRIEKGMSRDEVHAILGNPGSVSDSLLAIGWCAEAWSREDGARAYIMFAGNEVFDTTWSPTDFYDDELRWSPSAETVIDKLRRWFRL